MIESAAEQVLRSIDELLTEQDNTMIIPMTQVSNTVKEVVEKNAKLITRMQGKILRGLNTTTTHHLDMLDGVHTRILGGLDAWQSDVHYMLTQLASKSNSIQTGQRLEDMLIHEAEKAPELAYAGTLVLAVKEAIPYFEQLIEVLREIRDRMPGSPVSFPGEKAAADEDETIVDYDALIEDEAPITW